MPTQLRGLFVRPPDALAMGSTPRQRVSLLLHRSPTPARPASDTTLRRCAALPRWFSTFRLRRSRIPRRGRSADPTRCGTSCRARVSIVTRSLGSARYRCRERKAIPRSIFRCRRRSFACGVAFRGGNTCIPVCRRYSVMRGCRRGLDEKRGYDENSLGGFRFRQATDRGGVCGWRFGWSRSGRGCSRSTIGKRSKR